MQHRRFSPCVPEFRQLLQRASLSGAPHVASWPLPRSRALHAGLQGLTERRWPAERQSYGNVGSSAAVVLGLALVHGGLRRRMLRTGTKISINALTEATVDSGSQVSEQRFSDLPLSDEGKKAMKDAFGYDVMTDVQSKTFEPITQGRDLVVRAKTGSGKTLAFLLPTFERMLSFRREEDASDSIDVLVVSPVRELSMQIYNEANKLAESYAGLRAVCMTGGVSWQEDIAVVDEAASDVTILVATPGRLQSHIDKTPGFAARLARVKVLILDEVDELASQIFRAATDEIIGSCGPAMGRQNVFLSATMNEAVMEIMKEAAKAKHIDMISTDETGVPDHIIQTYSIAPTEDMTLSLWKSVMYAKEKYGEEAKIVVILMTGRIAAYYAAVFRLADAGLDVYEIHSRMKQNRRTKESDNFRACTSGILFTSDVTSRGLDYPGVMEVVQVGAPHSKAEYVHRLGRTGRAGQDGRGVLLLHEFEEPFLGELADLEVSPATLDGEWFDAAAVPDFPKMDIKANTKAQAYYSRINHVRRNNENFEMLDIMKEAHRFASSIGATDENGAPPGIRESNVEMMGVAGLDDPSVHIVPDPVK
eukprot:TRINITY_DN21018_c0_g1_i1.p1 TRINITY_DN21018_c0_g1~~TRINITY_DN21018_c0_g1_i1.p1  ORF type:complete len:606 (+),score=94.23 TRINITY_DN21018_c0_g1_i1:47-1819(+)